MPKSVLTVREGSSAKPRPELGDQTTLQRVHELVARVGSLDPADEQLG